MTLVRSGKGIYWEEENLANRTVKSIFDAIKENVQAAIIATPASMHLEQARELAQAGIHLLVEKPLSHKIEIIDQLITDVHKSEVIGMVGYVLRYDPAAMRFKEFFDNTGIIGKPLHARVECGSYLPDWRPYQDYRTSVSARSELGGGVLLELSHELDYIRWFFGEMNSVCASIQNSGTLDIDVEDSVDMVFNSKLGFNISVHLDFNSRINRRRCCVHCTEGDLIWDVISKKVVWRPANGPEEVINFDHDQDKIYREQLKHFFDCIEQNQKPIVSIEDGIAALQMVEAAKKSNKTAKKVIVV